MATVYSYARFSMAEQAEGDTLRRQIASRDAWLAAHPKFTLDTTLELTDAGRSGYDRTDWDTYALAEFLRRVESGYVAAGSYLVVENLDRLSREDVGTALELFLGILRKAITIVQLSPSAMEFRPPVDVHSLMYAIFELSRGHGESKMKSQRLGAAWANKREKARDGKLTPMAIPRWLKNARVKTDKPIVDKPKAAIVRRIYKLALEGRGGKEIARLLNAEGVPVMGKTSMAKRGQRGVKKAEKVRMPVTWSDPTILHILTTRTVLGEYQPFKGWTTKTRKPDGEPIKGFYPAIVSEDEFNAVQDALSKRTHRGAGRRGKHTNLFAGMLTDMRDGGALTYCHTSAKLSTIVPVGARTGNGVPWMSFPADVFESNILDVLVGVTVADIQGEDNAAKKVASISGRIGKIKNQLGVWNRQMDDENIDDATAATIKQKLNGLNLTLTGLNADLAAAQREASNPVAEAWGETRGLIGLLRRDPSDEMRIKLKAGLRRSINDVKCLFTGHRRHRLAAVVVCFRSGATQFYLISHQRLAEPITQCVSVRDTKVTFPTNLAATERKLLAAAERASEKSTSPLGEYLGQVWPNESWTRVYSPK